MPDAFAGKLEFALKFLSLSRARLAADLGVDKSVVGRWVTGAVRPSAHNLSQLTALVATRVEGFTTLDWERDLNGLAAFLGVDPGVVQRPSPPLPTSLPFPFLDQVLATTRLRGPSYEGFFRSTRPLAGQPGFFTHDHGLLRLDASGFLRLTMANGGTFVDAWILLLHNQLFVIGSELTSGSPVFGVFNGSPALKVLRVDGIILTSSLDPGRTPTSAAVLFERVGDLSGDREADDRHLRVLAADDPTVSASSIPDDLRAHLVRDIGPAQLAIAGDWLLRMPVSRSLAK